MKKAMVGVIAVVVAAVVGCTVYEVMSSTSNTTTAVTSSVNHVTSSNISATESSNTASSATANTTDSLTSTKTKAVSKDGVSGSESTTENSSAKMSKDVKKEGTESSTTSKSSTTESSTTKSSATESESGTTKSSATESSTTEPSTTENSGTTKASNSNNKATTQKNDTSSSTTNSNIIDGQPVLTNNNEEVSSYYGTWTVGDKIGSARIGNGENSTNPTGEAITLTKSLYSFDGTVIENPNYYIIATNASSYFGSEGWSGNVGTTSNGIIRFIIAVPSNVKVTTSTIYKYETQSKIIINDGSLAIMNSGETVYSASL